MSYLIRQDYTRLIQPQHLSDLVGANFALLESFETAAIEEVTSYLIQKYDTAFEFTDISLHNKAAAYQAKARVYIDATSFSAASTYAQFATVLYNGSVYYATNAITPAGPWNAAQWTLIGKQYDLFYAVTPYPDWDYYATYNAGRMVYYSGKVYTALTQTDGSQPDQNPTQWGSGTPYSVPNNTQIWDTAYWAAGDSRNQRMVQTMIDVVLFHLHTRISPENVPEHREIRYNNAIAWLKSCAKGDHITAGLRRIQPRVGNRIRYGSSLPKQNNNF